MSSIHPMESDACVGGGNSSNANAIPSSHQADNVGSAAQRLLGAGRDARPRRAKRPARTPKEAVGRALPGEVRQAIDLGSSLRWIHKETERYLDRLARAASEGRAVDEANNYLRWLIFSGVLDLLEKSAFVEPQFLTLRKKCSDLQDICRPHLQGRAQRPSPSQARVDELNDKVDVLLSLLAKPAATARVMGGANFFL